MIHKCPNCTTALIFNPATDMLECTSCRSTFSPNQFSSDEEMEMNVYSCTACGAELAVNGVESSTFCSYCGQPTIVFDRVSSAKKPEYIIPFSVTKDQAINSIRKHLSSGYFVPQEIKDFSVERIRGIYVPFWLYDINYADEQYLKGEVKSGKHSYTYYYYRSADVTLHDLTLDASDQLSDESTQRLEPYDTKAMRPFESGYLSGFYADCFDTDQNKLQYIARQRSKELFDKEVEKSVNAEDIEILKNNPKSEILKSSYAMFPAWFMTFRYQDEPYTIMVNGQTSKVVGAVPYDKKKVTVLYWIIAIIATLILTPIMYFMITSGDSDGFETILYFGFGGLCMWAVGLKKIAQIKLSIGLSKAANMNHFVKDRQEG